MSEPVLKVIRGDATAEEIAAVVAVLAAMRGTSRPLGRPVPAWSAHRHQVRVTHRHGPGGWRASSLPH